MATAAPKRAEEGPGDDEGARPGQYEVGWSGETVWRLDRGAGPVPSGRSGGGREQAGRPGEPEPERFHRPLLGICSRLGSSS